MTLNIGALEELKRLLCVGLLVSGLYQRLENLNGKFPGVSLQLLLRTGQREIDRLWATPNEGPGATFSFSIPCRFRNVASNVI